MTNYKVPYAFEGGTAASPSRINSNFNYITDIMQGFISSQTPFCISTGNRDERGIEDLFALNAGRIEAKIGGQYPDATFSLANGSPKRVTALEPLDVFGSTYINRVPYLEDYSDDLATVNTTSELAGNPVWKAFDGDLATEWITQEGVVGADINITLAEAKLVTKYRVYSNPLTSDGSTWPSSWNLYGSVNGTEWELLDSVVGAENTYDPYEIEKPGRYKYFIYRVITNHGGIDTRVGVFGLYAPDPDGNIYMAETQTIYMGESELKSTTGKLFSSPCRPEPRNYYNDLVPAMTSNTVPAGYTASASSTEEDAYAYLACDKNPESYWKAFEVEGAFWQLQLPKLSRINSFAIKIKTIKGETEGPKTVKLSGSIDAVSWTPILEATDLVWGVDELKTFYLGTLSEEYLHFRIEGKELVTLAEVHLYRSDENGSYYNGDAETGDIWFDSSEPHVSQILNENREWVDFPYVPAGIVEFADNGSPVKVYTLPFAQNGININSQTTKDYAGNIVTNDQFESSINNNGYVQLPNGLLIQWGLSIGWTAIVFPKAFQVGVFSVNVTPMTTDAYISAAVPNASRETMTIHNGYYDDGMRAVSNIANYWIAIGK